MSADEAAAPPAAEQERPADGREPPAEQEQAPRDAQTLGREFSHRAARPGETGERLGAERDARSNFTGARVTADSFVGRDQINYITVTASGTRLRMVELSVRELELDRLYVPPDGFGRAEAAVRDHKVLVLRGRPGTGRYAYARRLLLGAGGGPVRRLHPETDPGSLRASELEPGGYLLADLDGPCAARLRRFDLEQLAAELRPGTTVVITAGDGDAFGDPDLGPYLLDVRAPDPDAVLRAHLRAAIGSPARAARVLGESGVGDLCRDRLSDGLPGTAVRLAELLAAAEPPVAASVRALLDVRPVHDLEQWFAGLPDLATQTLAIAVAALGGERYELVAGAAELLQKRLEPADQPPQAPGRFGATRGARLRALGAHLVPSSMAARHGGTVPGNVVRFQDRALARRLLLHVWDEYDEVRPELLNWLRACVRNEVPTVRVRAAVATGILAAQAFDHVRAAIVYPWAHAADPVSRDAAAAALGVAADAPELRGAVTGLVAAWSTDDAAPRLRATAVRAWRITLAGRSGDRCAEAVALLERCGGDEAPEVIEAVCESVAEMLEYGDGRFAAEALDLLTGWTAGRDPRKRVTGRLAFLLGAADLVQETGDGGLRPALLAIAGRDPAAAKIAGLWTTALNSADLHRAAQEVLAEWAGLVDADRAAEAALARLMAAAAADPRTRRIIGIAASRWQQAPHSSAAVIAALTPGRTRQ
ncbi:hypothetical protein [Actinomadura verrucosospora]|uniref:Uncharacterized protein n=1 Tax=Actinomadura verrucosospora TaxID=46165 RepID=A0A7D3ZF59_ACTVE|nr:hypothetical protein [Actinomadura verrucosospora]QKG21697.1 hypothetical protein ACTIVE_3335 [Actinomadura verrucosospora]